MTRRQLLGTILSSAAATRVARASDTFQNTENTLRRAAAQCGVRVGVQTSLTQLLEPDKSRFILANFNLISAGTEFKWAMLRPTQDEYNFRRADQIIEYTQHHQLSFHGHNLCWNAYNPVWLEKTLNRSNADRILADHITTVMKRYAGKVSSWDVVNEPVSRAAPGGLYNGPWLKALGPEYIDVAFHTAKAADPNSLRVLNMHHVEQASPECDETRVAAVALLEGLVKRSVPVDAVGLESHLDGSLGGWSEGCVTFLKKIRDMGLQVLITELDVNDTKIPDDSTGDFTKRDERVASVYSDYLLQTVDAGQITQVIFFAITDAGNWYDSMTAAQFLRRDHQTHRPSLLGPSMGDKPAYAATRLALSKLCAERAK